MAAALYSLHGASWSLLWGVLIGAAIWAVILELLELRRHRLLALACAILFLALYTSQEHQKGDAFKHATPVQKEELEEAAAAER